MQLKSKKIYTNVDSLQKMYFSASIKGINKHFTDRSAHQPLKVSLSTVKRLARKLDKRAEHAKVVELLEFADNCHEHVSGRQKFVTRRSSKCPRIVTD